MQQGDVLLFQTPDGGEINVINGTVEMSNGLDTAAYLSLFGGNQDDDGLVENAKSWWGNLDELEANQYRSETQHLLEGLPATSSNLRRIEDAANRDLKWFIDLDAAKNIAALATIPALNKVKIDVAIDADSTISFIENWTL